MTGEFMSRAACSTALIVDVEVQLIGNLLGAFTLHLCNQESNKMGFNFTFIRSTNNFSFFHV